MTTILAIDSATGPCSVAVWKDGRIAAYLENPKPAAQSIVLMPMVEEALGASGTDYSDLSHVAVTIGPGSFTGIRVGLAAARGIAFAAGIKTMGFTTLETMAFAVYNSSPRRGEVRRGAQAGKSEQVSPHPDLPPTGEGSILAVLNAGKGEYYYQLFGSNVQAEPHLGGLQEIMRSVQPETHIVSNVLDMRPLASVLTHPTASALAELAATRAGAAREPVPFYIRPPDAKLPVKKA